MILANIRLSVLLWVLSSTIFLVRTMSSEEDDVANKSINVPLTADYYAFLDYLKASKIDEICRVMSIDTTCLRNVEEKKQALRTMPNLVVPAMQSLHREKEKEPQNFELKNVHKLSSGT